MGYTLARSPESITIADVLRATTEIPYQKCSKRHLTPDGGVCMFCGIYNRGIEAIISEYSKITLRDYARILKNEELEVLKANIKYCK